MRVIVLTVFFAFCLLPLKGQKVVGTEVIAPVDSIPEFVKDKVTPELYEVLEALSHSFRINYSFLSDENYPEQKGFVYDFFKRIYDGTKKGDFKPTDSPRLLSVSMPLKLHADLQWEREVQYMIDENMQFCKLKAIVYAGKRSEKEQLQLEIWYVYDAAKQQVLPLKAQLCPIGTGECSPVRWIFNEKTRETGTFLPIGSSDTLIIQFSTLFSYKEPISGESCSESVQRKIAVRLDE